MANQLAISVGQHSDRGRKETNQDFHGVCIPREPQLGAKGIAIALADGISSSEVSQVAAQSAVTSLLDDYYCTSDAWSVKTSAERVLCLLYTSDAADERSSVDLGGRRIIKKKTHLASSASGYVNNKQS